jgi:thiamine-phosphate pyrophosphorylase
VEKEEVIDIFKKNFIYFVTCEKLSCGRSDYQIVEAVLKAGVRVIQLRDKESSDIRLFEKAQSLRKLTNCYNALLVINDRVDVALAVGADGVHLGQDDIPVDVVRKIANRYGRDLLIGLSTHNLSEVEIVEIKKNQSDLCPDYINIGPIFPTLTKKNITQAILKTDNTNWLFLKNIIQSTSFPFTVMGGIKAEHLLLLAKLGVQHFAMVSEITQQKNPKKHVEKMIAKLLSLECYNLKKKEFSISNP